MSGKFCAGLPDACDVGEKTLEERRNRLFSKSHVCWWCITPVFQTDCRKSWDMTQRLKSTDHWNVVILNVVTIRLNKRDGVFALRIIRHIKSYI